MKKRTLAFFALFFLLTYSLSHATFSIDWSLPNSYKGDQNKINILLESEKYANEKQKFEQIKDKINEIDMLIVKNELDGALAKIKEIEPQIDSVSDALIADLKQLNKQIYDCRKSKNCDKSSLGDASKLRTENEKKLATFLLNIINYVYIKAGDILYSEKKYDESIKYYIKNERMNYYADLVSLITRDRYKYSYILVNALKNVDFNIDRYKNEYGDSLLADFDVPIIGDLDGDGINEVIMQDFDTVARNENGIIIIKFLNKDLKRWEVYYKTIKSPLIDLSLRTELGKTEIIVKYKDVYKKSYPGAENEKEGIYEFENAIKTIKKFESADEETLHAQSRFNDNRSDSKLDFEE
jgi:hypothetical protein